MAVFNHERKFVFLCEPHTASRACVTALVENVPGSVEIQPHHMPIERIGFTAHGYTIVAVVRNPFEILMTKKLRPATRDWPMPRYFAERWDLKAIVPTMGYCYYAHRIVWYEYLLRDLQTIFGSEVKLKRVEKHRTPDKLPWHHYMHEDEYQRYHDREDVQRYINTFGYYVPYGSDLAAVDKHTRTKLCKPV